MKTPIQTKLFPDDLPLVTNLSRANLGTFQDSLRAPVHSWFVYPAGFSYKAVEEALKLYNIKKGQIIYDPFAGTGTTNVVAKQNGIDSFGVEAHPFIHFVAHTKLIWEYNFRELNRLTKELIEQIRTSITECDTDEIILENIFPELVRKCYSASKLKELYLCRETILRLPETSFRNLAKLALTNLLRRVADVATGWPYIAPSKVKTSKQNAVVIDELRTQLNRMIADIETITSYSSQGSEATVFYGDSRAKQPIEANSIDLVFTSPPYLNNFDYADRTRLEMYFWGEVKTWGDITQQVRTRLMMSATTQINRSDYDQKNLLSADLKNAVPKVAGELEEKIAQLSKLRLQKGGKKSYDILVGGYFNDMVQTLKETYRLLKPGTSCVLILGDSAPYGVYVPTHEYLGEIACGIGFSSYKVDQLRTRGNKWQNNPQRHTVALQECILTIHKI